MIKIREYMEKYKFNFGEGKSNDILMDLQYLVISSKKYPSIWLRITEEYISLSFMEASNEAVKLCEAMKKKLEFKDGENINTYYLDIFLKKYDYNNYEKEIDDILKKIKKVILNDEEYSENYKILF